MKKSVGRSVVYGLIIIVLLVGLLFVFIDGSGLFFMLELLGLIILAILSSFGLVGSQKSWGEQVLFVVFLLYIINLVLLWLYQGTLFFVLLFFAVIGFVLAVPKTRGKKKQSKEPVSTVLEPAPKSPETKSEKTSYYPGKFVASRLSALYHLPTCEWAQKIAPDRRVWFLKKELAWEKGYRAHNCVSN